MSLVKSVLKTATACFCLLAITVSGYTQRRLEITKEERQTIQEITHCKECDNPVMTLFKEAYEIANKVSEESAATSAAYKFARHWVTSNEVVAVGGGVAFGLFTPSELDENGLMSDTSDGQMDPKDFPNQPSQTTNSDPPPTRGLTVTTNIVCRNANLQTIPCP